MAARTYIFDGNGNVSEADPVETQPAKAKGFVLEIHDAEVISGAADLPDLSSRGVASALMQGDDRPRCEPFEDGAVLILHTLIAGKQADTYEPHVVRLWLEKARVIAIAGSVFSDMLGLIASAGHRAPASPGEFAARLALRSADRIEPMVDRLDERLDEIEERVSGTESATPRIRLGNVRRAAIGMRRHVLPQRDALTTLSVEDHVWLKERDRARLREAVAWMSRIYSELEAISERANLVREQLVDRRAEQTNRAMLVLAGVATIFMPLTLVSGVLGMNVAGIPFADQPWAFFGVVAGLVFVAGLLVAWLRSKKWL